MLNSACVYWIRNPDHTDIFNQGYVGVSLNIEKRLKTHIKRIKNKQHGNYNLLEKYNEKTVCETVLIASENYCYDIEAKLRPEKNIGWNINAGGVKPPSQVGIKRKEKYGKTWSPMQGKKHSENTKKKMSEASKGKPKSEVHKAKMRLRVHSEETKHKMSLAKKNKPNNSPSCRGMKWWNDGVITVMSFDAPSGSFIPGRIYKRKNKE